MCTFTKMSSSAVVLSNIWRTVRGPFRKLSCKEHRWERYDYNQAGCLDCGVEHICNQDLAGSCCPLQTADDGSVCCVITGFSLPVIRYGKEFIPGCGMTVLHKEAVDFSVVVASVVDKILYSAASRQACEEDMTRKIGGFRALLLRTLKEHKLKHPRQTVCLPVLIGNVLHALKLPRRTLPDADLGRRCSPILSRCIGELLASCRYPKQLLTEGFILGLLYLMRQGLVFEGKSWLPKIKSLQLCLPPETLLFKLFKISNKTICEVENEVKCILRRNVGLI